MALLVSTFESSSNTMLSVNVEYNNVFFFLLHLSYKMTVH